MVFTTGPITGFASEEKNPEGDVHLYRCPLSSESPMVIKSPKHKLSFLTIGKGRGFTLNVFVMVSLNGKESVRPFGLLIHALTAQAPAVKLNCPNSKVLPPPG